MTRTDVTNGEPIVDQKERFKKTPIQNHTVLNEAYDYPKKVSFSRGMRVELDNCVMLFISGTASVGEDGESLYPGDVRAQSWRMFNNISGLLESEGADWHDVVRTTCYLADFRRYDEFNEVRNAFYEKQGLDPLPASTCVEARICRPELLVEVEAIAIIPRDRAR
ncbi:MAG: RidA family protein [Planctomycetota bacterium]|jgi:enamine deaminase RidA (YjgF/YER057c/UK114 family)